MHFASRRTLERKRVYLVCDGIDSSDAAEFGFAATYRSLDEALGPAATLAVSFPSLVTYRQMPWREG